jgi:hypothetical protein
MITYEEDNNLERDISIIRLKKALIAFSAIFAFLLLNFFFFTLSGFDYTNIVSDKNTSIVNTFLFLGVIFLFILGFLSEGIYNADHYFYHKFAKINNLNYEKEKTTFYDCLLVKKENKKVRNIISGKINDRDIEFFNYIKKVEELEISYSLLKIESNISFPNMLFLSKSLKNDYTLNSSMSALNLDGNLNDKFSFLSEKGFEIEALEVFCQ